MNPSNPLAAHRIKAISEALREKSLTLDELHQQVCLCREQARRYVVHLHRTGAIHIEAWSVRQVGRSTRIPVFKCGKGEDAPRPANFTSAERQASHMARVRADDDRYDLHKARGRARKVKLERDALVCALFGRPGERTKEAA